MAAPSTVAAAGYYQATLGGTPSGEATLRMRGATRGSFTLGGNTWNLTGDATARRFRGKAPGSVLELRITNRNRLSGSIDGTTLDLARAVLRPIPPAELAQSDPGPAGAIKAVIDATPDYKAAIGDTTTFWYAFGPVLYRGRLDGTARVLCIASDPGPAECLPFARRTLIGDSGQKVQGFLDKLGLVRSYAMVNAFAVAMKPSKAAKGLQALRTNAALRTARHALYDSFLASGSLQAVVAFGNVAHEAYDLWRAANPAVAAVPVFKLAHPAAIDREGNDAALGKWKSAVGKLRGIVTPDPGGNPNGPNYGRYFTELDYGRIPRWDLPAVSPVYVGDDSWGRAATPRHNNCCARPSPDDSVSLILTPPPGEAFAYLRYTYEDGALTGAKAKDGQAVAIDGFGIPT